MSPKENPNKEAMIEFLGVDDYRKFWNVVKEDLHARVLSTE
jgi:hypothetical protein